MKLTYVLRNALTIVVAVTLLVSVFGCTTQITQQSVTLSNGQVVDYVTGKLAGDGQEGIFKDVFIDGKPVSEVSMYSGGQSLYGQILQGTAGSAMVAGGVVGGAALLRPIRVNESHSQSYEGEVSSVNVNDNDQKYSGSIKNSIAPVNNSSASSTTTSINKPTTINPVNNSKNKVNNGKVKKTINN